MSCSSHNEPIAIIGSGCRFAGESSSPSRLWDLLRQPRDVLSTLGDDRFNSTGFYHPDSSHHGASNIRHSYLLSEDHRLFDTKFFNCKPSEAESMDPQHRMLLEVVYEALEAGGQKLEGMQGSNTAVYVGVMSADYADMQVRDLDSIPTYFSTGTARSILSNRISYFFDWHGPCMTIDTACSSSLVSLDGAVKALQAGTSRVAVAAGTNLCLGPEQYIAESKLKMLSPTGRSSMWSSDANGYARGDGIAAVVLKKLSDAIADGDHIECVVRGTGVNQDGKTKGITMPSRTAQASLIHETYTKAGLNPLSAADRCQYFEAHGTGTPAGDPIEAGAIAKAFFGKGAFRDDEILHVGSIKTVLGHTEGTAGLAGVLKASLALQHGVIPPNMHFNELSPAVQPFYKHLRILTQAAPWPAVAAGQPKRASVNSFGFGGTNAHAILESYENAVPNGQRAASTPFVFSATSEKSLTANLANFSSYLKNVESIDLPSLSYTLTRRSTLPVKVSFSASNLLDLYSAIDDKLEKDDGTIGTRSTVKSARLLGVFTGQGAQWATMGRELIQKSAFVRNRLAFLDKSLAELPEADRPAWTLRNELLAEGKASRVGFAAFSQPLCTALQIVLVDLLSAAKVKFEAVVGHSSGEIAAAYAAGFISAYDAVRIAYYRGFHGKLACGPGGMTGAMLAVGTSLADAQEFCELEEFEGRLTVAACNSGSSVTLSGDADAINEAKDIFEDEKKFARLLKVEVAYHSHHMQPCSEPYVKSLTDCDIQIMTPPVDAPMWFSSVQDGELVSANDSLKHMYWKDNMVSTVLFAPAVEHAVGTHGSFDMAVEVGPHPALQGPASQMLQELTSETVPYTGTLRRGKNDVWSLSDCLGSLFVELGDKAADFRGYDDLLTGKSKPVLLKGLPSYAWDHERVFWSESRTSIGFRTRKEPPHELLGTRANHNTEKEHRWHNLLRPKEIPWLDGHRLQGQMVFPAAGYIAMAVEASHRVRDDKTVQLIELNDLAIGRPITFDNDSSEVEVMFSMLLTAECAENFSATFSCSAALNRESTSLAVMVTGSLKVSFGNPQNDILPGRANEDPSLSGVEVDRFYDDLSRLGYGYTGAFQGLVGPKRKLGMSSGFISNPVSDNSSPDNALLVHPGLIDIGFQAIFLAHSAPNDGGLYALHVPNLIKRIRIDPNLCRQYTERAIDLPFQATAHVTESTTIEGDVAIYTADNQQSMIQVEGCCVVPFSQAKASDDRPLFSKFVWNTAPSDDTFVKATPHEEALAMACERATYFYLRQIVRDILPSERHRAIPTHRKLLELGKHATNEDLSLMRDTWVHDSQETIESLFDQHPENVDLEVIRQIGKKLPTAIREQSAVEIDIGLLENYFSEGLGFSAAQDALCSMVSKLAHIHPRMRILEIDGANVSKSVHLIRKLKNAFGNYTFTKRSLGALEHASDALSEFKKKTTVKTLDIEKIITEQGFALGSYDLVIFSDMSTGVHDTAQAMENIRHLLRPGGQLIMVEATNSTQLRVPFIMNSISDSSPDKEMQEPISPPLTTPQWHSMVKKFGFSGIDALVTDAHQSAYPYSIMMTQATDDAITALRQPLSSSFDLPQLVIVGGRTLAASRLAEDVAQLLSLRCKTIHNIESIEDLPDHDIPPMSTVLVLAELDEPTFKQMTDVRLQCMKTLFDRSRNILWVTQGCMADEPLSNMMVGLGRTIKLESPHLRLQFLDFDKTDILDVRFLTQALLRLCAAETLENDGKLSGLLWYNEPEISIKHGKSFIPRIIPDEELNDRYNSSRRDITRQVSLNESSVELIRLNGSYELQESSVARSSNLIEVRHSTLMSIKTPIAQAFVIDGRSVATGEQVIALADTNASSLHIRPEHMVVGGVRNSDESSPALLETVVASLLARTLLDDVAKSVVIHDASENLATALLKLDGDAGRLLLTTNDKAKCRAPWIYLHPHMSARATRALMPATIDKLVDLSTSSELCAKLRPLLSERTSVLTRSSIWKYEGDMSGTASAQQLLQACVSSNAPELTQLRSPCISAGDLHNALIDCDTIVSWHCDASLAVKVLPINRTVQFRSDVTYLLLGLSGQLGQSLCLWMAQRGAKHMVLTSRTPATNDFWMSEMAAVGANVRIMANDITNKKSLVSLVTSIEQDMPKIGGVVNGAMVLLDGPFANVTMDVVSKGIRPKVDGTRYLDEIFSENTLDFFISLSSIANAVGNSGQTIYGAANAFMTAMTAQRRKRGLAASAIDMGPLTGIGYLNRLSLNTVLDYLHKSGFMLCSEREFHHMFAEAVIASPAHTGTNYEIITGIRILQSDEEIQPPWFFNPRMQHFIRQAEGFVGSGNAAEKGASVKSQLEKACSEQEVHDIVQDSFILQLQRLLKLSVSGSGEQASVLQLRSDEMGIDSLNAVELRSWFLSDLQVDIPVLKILGGSTMSDLLAEAIEKLPATLCPAIGGDSQPVVDPTTAAPKAAEDPVSIAISEPIKTLPADLPSHKIEATRPVVGSSQTATIKLPVNTKSDISNNIIDAYPTAENDVDMRTSESEKSDPFSGTSSLSSCVEINTPSPEASSTSSVSDPAESKLWMPEEYPVVRTRPMSLNQQQFWFLNRYLQDRSTPNITAKYCLTGNVNTEALSLAIRSVGQRHEALRTRFYEDDTHVPTQAVLETSPLSLEVRHVSSEVEVDREFNLLTRYSYDLERGAIIRIILLSLSRVSHFLLVGYNHINMDGVSLQILMSDIEKLYTNKPLLTGFCQYPDFTDRQQQQISNGSMKKEMAYWQKEFSQLPQPLPLLPMSKFGTRQVLQYYELDLVLMEVPKQLSSAIKDACRRYKTTPFHFYLATLKVMLFRFLDVEDLCIGISDANRLESDVLGSIGMFLNLLPLRFRSDATQTFGDALKEAKRKVYSALEHSKLPFDLLLKQLNVPRSASHSPLFQVHMDYRQGSVSKHTLGDCELVASRIESGRTAYDLAVDVAEQADAATIIFKTQKSIYSSEATNLIAKTYMNILESFAKNPATRIDRVSLHSYEDTKVAIDLGRGPTMESKWAPTLPQQVDSITVAHATEVAIKDGHGNVLTYQDLSDRVRTIAKTLTAKGVEPNATVAVFQFPSADWICSMLAIMRIGAVYVPLDLRHPLKRLAMIVRDCHPSAILCHTDNMEDAADLGVENSLLVNLSDVPTQPTAESLDVSRPDSAALILYTSGSTGTPKGIVLKHSNIRSQIEALSRHWNVGKQKVLQQTAFSFDISVDQIGIALCNGGMLYVVPKELRTDPSEIVKIIASEGMTYTKATPSEYTSWLQYGSQHLKGNTTWQQAWGGGEAMTESFLARFRALGLPQLRLLNCYGPSEITIACSKIEIPYMERSDKPVPVGLTIPNYSVYVLDNKQNPVPVGLPGEIVVGGAGVSQGYIHNEALTKTKYLPDIFAPPEYAAKGWNTMYRTGDRGYMRADGVLMFMGRIEGDTQIKLRGLRIELGDVESSILQSAHGALDRVVVTVRGDPQYLVAHVVFSKNHIDKGARDSFLKQLLRDLPLAHYMRPSVIIPIEQIPLTTHFKVDRKAIAALPLAEQREITQSDAELTDTEHQLKDIWEQTLSKDVVQLFTIDADTDFFAIGGNSMLLVRLQALIREHFGVALPLADMFEASTLGNLAAKIEHSNVVQNINWEDEIAIQTERLLAIDGKSVQPATGKVVLLTGATGYLGQRVLSQLISESKVAQVHCVAVRDAPESAGRKVPVGSSKVLVHRGDLASPFFGMDPKAFEALAAAADVIIHCGAKRSFWDNYSVLRRINVTSTKQLVEMANTRKVPIHFISSPGVCDLPGQEHSGDSAATRTPPLDGSNGYVASKWASERYLENAAQQLGVSVSIHRFRASNESIKAPPQLMNELLQLSLITKTLPSANGWTGSLDLLPTEVVTKGIVNAALSSTDGPSKELTTFLTHQSVMRLDVQELDETLNQMIASLPAARKITFTKTSALEWMGEIKRLGFTYILASHDIHMGRTVDGKELISRR